MRACDCVCVCARTHTHMRALRACGYVYLCDEARVDTDNMHYSGHIFCLDMHVTAAALLSMPGLRFQMRDFGHAAAQLYADPYGEAGMCRSSYVCVYLSVCVCVCVLCL